MTDFKNFLNDFSHLVSGMSSVAGGMKSEIEHNMQSAFTTLATQTGFVRRDEFDSLLERFEQAVQKINLLETELNHIKNTFIAKD